MEGRSRPGTHSPQTSWLDQTLFTLLHKALTHPIQHRLFIVFTNSPDISKTCSQKSSSGADSTTLTWRIPIFLQPRYLLSPSTTLANGLSLASLYNGRPKARRRDDILLQRDGNRSRESNLCTLSSSSCRRPCHPEHRTHLRARGAQSEGTSWSCQDDSEPRGKTRYVHLKQSQWNFNSAQFSIC